MKKFIAFVMILSLGMLTIGCTPAATPVKDKPKDKPAATTTDKEKDKDKPVTPATGGTAPAPVTPVK